MPSWSASRPLGSRFGLWCLNHVCAALCVGKDRKSTRLNSSHLVISYAVFCLKKKKKNRAQHLHLNQLERIAILVVQPLVVPFCITLQPVCVVLRHVLYTSQHLESNRSTVRVI